MLTMIQILKFYMSNGLNHSEIMDQLTDLADNHRSEHFDLNDRQLNEITRIFYDDDKFDLAWFSAELD